MNTTTRSTRLVAAVAALAITFTILQSVFSLFASAPATQLAKAQSATPTIVTAR